MTHMKKFAATAVLLTAMGALFALGAVAGRPGKAPPVPGKEEIVDVTKPVDPGIRALVAASTDIVVVDVVDTRPRRAIEGARDTVRLKVAKTLLGRLAPGDAFGVYYHLLWADDKGEVLEPVKFVKGRRYLVFLRSHVEDRGGTEGRRTVYELTDQWLAVQPDHARLIKEVAAAVRAAHGDARGEWSPPVGPLQARLVASRAGLSNGTPVVRVSLDVRNVAGGDNTVEFTLEKASFNWQVTDARGLDAAGSVPPGNWISVPVPPLVLAAGERGRVVLSKTGAGVMKDGVGHLDLGVPHVWGFERGEPPYFLRGKITVEPTARRRWSGTLDLPPVRLPLERD